MMPMQIFENHLHLRLDGRNVDAVRDFQRAGGTHLVIAHLSLEELPIASEDDYRNSYERTLKIAEMVRKNLDVKVFVTVGPYPVDIIRLQEKVGLKEAKRVMLKGMDIAGKYVQEKKAIAIGEIGRPHFPVSEEILQASNEILSYGMCVARDVGCPVVLHTESATPEVFKDLAGLADRAGLSREKVVKHYSTPIIDEEKNCGLFPSILSSRRNVREALAQGNRFLMETDYLDDPARPGAVLGPATVPKRTRAFLREGLLTREDIYKIHKENPERVYGIEVD